MSSVGGKKKDDVEITGGGKRIVSVRKIDASRIKRDFVMKKDGVLRCATA
jgi:hypothetical protein